MAEPFDFGPLYRSRFHRVQRGRLAAYLARYMRRVARLPGVTLAFAQEYPNAGGMRLTMRVEFYPGRYTAPPGQQIGRFH